MKRLSVLLIIILVAGLISGCRYIVIEDDPVLACGSAALAESEGQSLFVIEEIDTGFYDDELPPNLTPKPSKTPEPTAEPKTTKKKQEKKTTPDPNATQAPIGFRSRDEDGENAVHKLQARLQELGYLDQDPDGSFGSKTLKALKRFQRDNGLEQTGVLDEATDFMLFPRPEVTTSPEDVLYTEGDTGADIWVVQRRLRQYGFYTRNLSGQYDEYTTDCVQDFQEYAVEYYGTEFDDPAPLLEEPTLLVNDADIPGTTPEPVVEVLDTAIPEMPVLAPEATLRPSHALDGVMSENLYQYLKDDRFPTYRLTVQRGDTGREVERVQCRLTTLGYYYEDITGEYDKPTTEAMKSFQKRNDLQVTGIADEESQRRLFSANATPVEPVDQPYYIKVSIDDQRVYIYRWNEGSYSQLIKTMICSTGYGSTTPKGVFVSPGQRDARWHYFAEYHCWAQYAFIIKGSILFHSVIYSSKNEASLRRSTLAHLGHKASHGCVRLKVEDAKWIYEHCGEGQVIEIY